MTIALDVARAGFAVNVGGRTDVPDVMIIVSATDPSNNTAGQLAWLHEVNIITFFNALYISLL